MALTSRTQGVGRRSLALATAALISGCASFNASMSNLQDGESAEQYKGVDRHSSYPAIRRGSFEQVNLLELIDPKQSSLQEYAKAWNRDRDGPPLSSERYYGQRYDLALQWFRTSGATREAKTLHRNSVQDKILAVATSRCNVFKTYLRRQQSDTNFFLGSATTVAGVLGAVLPGVKDSRNLAGLAGIFSGVQAEYNQAYYSNLASHVIVQGIELRQNRMREELLKKRRDMDIDACSMEAAINDAIAIDGTCSTLAGLMEAQESIREIERPGLGMASRTLASVKALGELQSSTLSELGPDKLQHLLQIAGSNVPSLMVTAVSPGDFSGGSSMLEASRNSLVSALDSWLEQHAKQLGREFQAQAEKSAVKAELKLTGTALTSKVLAEGGALLADLRKDKAAVAVCLAQLEANAGAVGQKRAVLSVVQGDSVREPKAQADVVKAYADLQRVVKQIGTLRRAIEAEVEDYTAKLKSALDKKLPTLLSDDDVSAFWSAPARPKPSAAKVGISCADSA